MRKSRTFRQAVLRFRRWSRKAYAAFVSLRHVVTIGHLSSSIADSSLKKNTSLNKGIPAATGNSFPFGESNIEQEWEEEREKQLSRILAGLFSFLNLRQTIEIAHAAYRVTNEITNYTKAGHILQPGYVPPLFSNKNET